VALPARLLLHTTPADTSITVPSAPAISPRA
jgi:hypothetical protein